MRALHAKENITLSPTHSKNADVAHGYEKNIMNIKKSLQKDTGGDTKNWKQKL